MKVAGVEFNALYLSIDSYKDSKVRDNPLFEFSHTFETYIEQNELNINNFESVEINNQRNEDEMEDNVLCEERVFLSAKENFIASKDVNANG